MKEYLDSLEKAAPGKGAGLRTFNVFVDGQYYEVEVECTSGAPVITAVAPRGRGASWRRRLACGCGSGPGRRAQARAPRLPRPPRNWPPAKCRSGPPCPA